MRAKADALPDAYRVGRDVLDAAHQAEAFIAVDQRYVEGLALRRVHDGRRIDGAEPLADAPFQLVAAREGTDHARIEHGTAGFRTELIGKLAAGQMIKI